LAVAQAGIAGPGLTPAKGIIFRPVLEIGNEVSNSVGKNLLPWTGETQRKFLARLASVVLRYLPEFRQ